MCYSKYFSYLVLAVCFWSCQKSSFDDSELKVFDQLTRSDNSPTILKFESEDDMYQQIDQLMQMSDEELQAWYTAHNFESQYEAMYRVATELDNASTIEEADVIKQKYASYFLFNESPEDNERYNPYLPTTDSRYSLVCNIAGDVIINNKIVNFNTCKNVFETGEYQLTNTLDTRVVEERINYLYSEVDKRKFWAEGSLDSDGIVLIELTAKKKTAVLGWIKYKTQYYIKVQRRNDGWLNLSPDFYYYYNNGGDGLWTNELKSGTLIPVGTVKSNNTATMSLYIYSRGTDVAGAGVLNLQFSL